MGLAVQTKDKVWLRINSGAPNKQGAGLGKNRKAKEKWTIKSPILLDETGETGRAYGAETTPQMFVIDDQGVIVYAGGLDNAPMGEPKGGKRLAHLEKALKQMGENKKITTPKTPPYGCCVKY